MVALCVSSFVGGCSTTYPARDPLGERLPDVEAKTLEGDALALPGDLAGAPAILLVGYKQRAQFDLDRWWMGLQQAEVKVTVIEVPTIPALVPTLISGWIDEGMRAGIPEEGWGVVATLYGDSAEPVARFTGNEGGNNARVLALDGSGQVVWFTDRGYSAGQALELAELLEGMGGE